VAKYDFSETRGVVENVSLSSSPGLLASTFVLKLWDKAAKIHAETLPDLFIMNKATSSCLNLEDRSQTLAKGTFSPQITNV
jgi:hypothetical protein